MNERFSKRTQTFVNDLMLLERSAKRVPLDSEIIKWVKQAILHFKSFRVKHWKNDDVNWNVFETQPNSCKWFNVVRKEWKKSSIRFWNNKVSKTSNTSFQVISRITLKEWWCKMKCFRNATKLLEMT